MIQVLIIEDEIKTAKELKSLIEKIHPDIEIVGILSSIKASVQWFKNNPQPDLIFSDIQLADGTCFEIFRQVVVTAPIIFCTAFDEYAIQAFDTNGIDYLLKPIDEEKLKRGLDKFSKLKFSLISEDEKMLYQKQLEKMMVEVDKSYRNNLLVYYQEKIIPIKTENIEFIHSSDGLVTIYTEDNKRYHINYTLDTLSRILNPDIFFKANRQYIVNRRCIDVVERYFSRRLLVKTKKTTPEPIVISKIRTTDFLHWLDQ